MVVQFATKHGENSAIMSDMAYEESVVKDMLAHNPHLRIVNGDGWGKISAQTITLPDCMKRSKYGNKKTEYRDQLYDSKKEADRARDLDILVAAGEISAWERQHKFEFFLNGVDICDFFVDFKITYPDGRIVYEDVKSVATQKDKVYRLKKKLLKAFKGIDVIEYV